MDDSARIDAGSDKRDQRSAGALLRAAREAQGMHIATLAAGIKVAPRKLEALEHDRWDELPGPTFTRALAQAVCRALRADPAPVMELLPPADTSMLDSTFGSINEPFAGRGGREPGLPNWLRPGPWLFAAVALLAAAALVMWLPAGVWNRLVSGLKPAASAGDATVSINVPAAPAQAQAASPLGVAPPPPSLPGTPTGATPSMGAAVVTGAGATLDASAANAVNPVGVVVASGAAAPSPTAAPIPAGALVIACSGRSWVEVLDGRGRVLVSRNLEAGETLGLDGLLPLQVVIGNASATQVTYKGTAIELLSRSRDNVARFDLR